MASEKTLCLWTDRVMTVCAYGAEDALAVAYTELGEQAPDDADVWTRVPDDDVVTVHSDDPGEPPTVTKTAREWAAEGRGVVCSTDW